MCRWQLRPAGRKSQVYGAWPKVTSNIYKEYLYVSRDGVVGQKRNLDEVCHKEERLELSALILTMSNEFEATLSCTRSSQSCLRNNYLFGSSKWPWITQTKLYFGFLAFGQLRRNKRDLEERPELLRARRDRLSANCRAGARKQLQQSPAEITQTMRGSRGSNELCGSKKPCRGSQRKMPGHQSHIMTFCPFFWSPLNWD